MVGGFKFLVEPQMLEATDQDSVYASLQVEKELLDMTTTTNTDITASYEENVETLEELKSNIVTYMRDEELDTTMSLLAKDYGLDIEVLEIQQEASAYIPEGLEAVTAKTITMTVYGDKSEFLALQEEFYDSSNMIISNATITTNASTADQYYTRYGVEVEGVMHITVVVYMQVDESIAEVEAEAEAAAETEAEAEAESEA